MTNTTLLRTYRSTLRELNRSSIQPRGKRNVDVFKMLRSIYEDRIHALGSGSGSGSASTSSAAQATSSTVAAAANTILNKTEQVLKSVLPSSSPSPSSSSSSPAPFFHNAPSSSPGINTDYPSTSTISTSSPSSVLLADPTRAEKDVRDLNEVKEFVRAGRVYNDLLLRYNPLQGLSTEDRVTATSRRVGLQSPERYDESMQGKELGINWALKDLFTKKE